jgi:hypothetical protein
MRASPYDLTGFGLAPITVEEPTGRAEYVRRQGIISERAAPLRRALLMWCERLLAHDVGYGTHYGYDALSERALPAGKMN